MPRFLLLSLLAFFLRADTPAVPDPPKADLPFLLLAQNLVPTEAFEAKTDDVKSGKKKQGTTYWVPGEHSTAKTPLASPIFVMKEDTLAAERLQVFPFEIRNGRREVTFLTKKAVKPYTLTVTKVADTVYRMEVNESLTAGEYALTPNGSNQVFCFAVY